MIDILILNLWFMLQFLYRWSLLLALPKTLSSVPTALKYVVQLVLLFPFTLIGFLADCVMNNTVVPLVLEGGWFEELTFSTRLERLCVSDPNTLITRDLCVQIALAINRVCPTHNHIKVVL